MIRIFINRNFDQVAKLANEPIHFALDYPRRYEDLARARAAIVEHARKASGEARPTAARDTLWVGLQADAVALLWVGLQADSVALLWVGLQADRDLDAKNDGLKPDPQPRAAPCGSAFRPTEFSGMAGEASG